jgi:tRNA (Thr-GGU) A37 N-methylase
VPLARGQVILHSHVPNAALEGLHEFGHIWLIYAFHANTNVLGGRLSGTDQEQVRSTLRAKGSCPKTRRRSAEGYLRRVHHTVPHLLV